MRVLGISAFYHDSAAALIEDGHLVGAAQEERFTRKKHDSAFPQNAVQYCLDTAGIKLADVDYVAFYDKPFLKFERLLETYLAYAPRGFNSFRMAMPLWLKEKLFQKTLLRDEMKHWQPDFDWQKRLLFGEHHQSHAASAFFPSPYEEAAVLCMDGVGEWATTSLGLGPGQQARDAEGDPLPALDRAALFGLHLLYGLQGQLRRVQGHGPGALWRAEVQGQDPRAHRRPQGGRQLPPRPEVLRLLHRAAHDEREVRRAVRRQGAQAR